jgi:hypothetical protein
MSGGRSLEVPPRTWARGDGKRHCKLPARDTTPFPRGVSGQADGATNQPNRSLRLRAKQLRAANVAGFGNLNVNVVSY